MFKSELWRDPKEEFRQDLFIMNNPKARTTARNRTIFLCKKLAKKYGLRLVRVKNWSGKNPDHVQYILMLSNKGNLYRTFMDQTCFETNEYFYDEETYLFDSVTNFENLCKKYQDYKCPANRSRNINEMGCWVD